MRFLLPSLLLCFSFATTPSYDDYLGGRPGFSEASIRLFADSTYDFHEYVHTGARVHDRGKWSRSGDRFVLNSATKKGKPARFPHFVQQEFSLHQDTLQFIPRDSTQTDYYAAYYRFVKSHP